MESQLQNVNTAAADRALETYSNYAEASFVPNAAVAGLAATGPFLPGVSSIALLELQRSIQLETQLFTTTTNILKAEHDARMSSVQNIRP